MRSGITPKNKTNPHHAAIIFAIVTIALFLSLPSWSEPDKDILELEYSSVSGKTGRESVIKIYSNGDIYYQIEGGCKDDGLRVDCSKRLINFAHSRISQAEKKRLKTIIENNKFFSMKESYIAKYPVTDKGGSCIKVSKPRGKIVCVEDTSDVPSDYYKIIKELEQLIGNLPKNYLEVQAKYKLKQWPYSFKIKLFELRDKSSLDAELFNYFVDLLKTRNILFSEDNLIFRPYITCQGLPFEEFSKNKDCKFDLHSGKVIIWPTSLNIKLSEIREERVFIGNEKYQEIKEILAKAVGYLDVFIENEISQDTYAYRLGLSLNQKIEEVSRKH